jgi:hypothetical protein
MLTGYDSDEHWVTTRYMNVSYMTGHEQAFRPFLQCYVNIDNILTRMWFRSIGKVHYRVHNSTPRDATKSSSPQVQLHHDPRILPNIILPSISRSPACFPQYNGDPLEPRVLLNVPALINGGNGR